MQDHVREFIQQASEVLDTSEPVVELGAYQTRGQEGFADLRTFFPGKTYLGCDLVAGPGVDRIEDVHKLSFADDSVGTVIIADTLEHVADPYRAVREIHRVLRPGGVAIVTTPFNFPIHYLPDYTRFTPEGMSLLLSGFDAQAVFSQGDAQNPFGVYAIALKGGGEVGRVAFEGTITRLLSAWNVPSFHDPLLRFQPLVEAARWRRWDTQLTALEPGHPLEQTFRCSGNGLTRLDLLLAPTAGRSNGWLRFRLKNAAGSELAMVDISTQYAWEQRWVAFTFPAVADSAGKDFAFSLEAIDPPSTVAPYATTTSRMADAVFSRDGAQQPGSICFEAFCERPLPAETVGGFAAGPTATGPSSDPSSALLAARAQADDLRYTSLLLRQAIERMHHDLLARLDGLDKRSLGGVIQSLLRKWRAG